MKEAFAVFFKKWPEEKNGTKVLGVPFRVPCGLGVKNPLCRITLKIYLKPQSDFLAI